MDEDWEITLTNNGKDFEMLHTPCGGEWSGGSDTAENTAEMIENNKNSHLESV